MIFAFISLSSGLGLLYFGAEGLVRGSSRLAFRLGLSRLVIGLTIVAFGTSMPEMVVSVQTAWAHQGDISLGNVIGSNICNIALILGLSSLVRPLPVHVQVVRLQIPIMIGVSFLIWVLLLDRMLTRVEGECLFLGILLYTYGSLYLAKKEYAQLNKENGSSPLPLSTQPPWLDALFILGGLVMLIIGAKIFISGSVTLARILHIREAVIGLTIVAVGTSLPELATSMVAAFKREGDIAIGNVVGSNIFNILAILGVASMVRPIEMQFIRVIS